MSLKKDRQSRARHLPCLGTEFPKRGDVPAGFPEHTPPSRAGIAGVGGGKAGRQGDESQGCFQISASHDFMHSIGQNREVLRKLL